MNFASPIFLFAFLPLTAALYRLVGEWVRRDPRLVKSAEKKA